MAGPEGVQRHAGDRTQTGPGPGPGSGPGPGLGPGRPAGGVSVSIGRVSVGGAKRRSGRRTKLHLRWVCRAARSNAAIMSRWGHMTLLPGSDPTETPPPPDKEAPPPPDELAPPPGKMLIQEEICSEISQSTQRFTQSLSGLSEVPPPPAFYSCCQAAPEPPGEPGTPGLHVWPKPSGSDSLRRSGSWNFVFISGLTMKALLILIFSIFIISVLYSG